MKAKYPGKCRCGEAIAVDDEILYDEDAEEWTHEACVVDPEPRGGRTRFEGTSLDDMGY